MNGHSYYPSNNFSNDQSYQQPSVGSQGGGSSHHPISQRCRGTVVTIRPIFFFIKPDSTNSADSSSANNVYCLKSSLTNGNLLKIGDKVEYSLMWNDRYKQHRAHDVQICESSQPITPIILPLQSSANQSSINQSSINRTSDQASYQKPTTQTHDRINVPQMTSHSTTQFVQFKGSNTQSHNQSHNQSPSINQSINQAPSVNQSFYQTNSPNGELDARPYETQQYNMHNQPTQQVRGVDQLMPWSQNIISNHSMSANFSSQSSSSSQFDHFTNGNAQISNRAIDQQNQFLGHSQAGLLTSGTNQTTNQSVYQAYQQSQANNFISSLNPTQGEPDPKSSHIINTPQIKQSNQQYFGKIDSVLPGYYFIQMDNPSEEIRNKNPDGKVFCMPSQIKSERPMQVGDRVQFVVWLTATGKNKGKHQAINVKHCASTNNQINSPPTNQLISQAPILSTNPQNFAMSTLANNQKRDAINQSSSTNHQVNNQKHDAINQSTSNHLLNNQVYQGHVVKTFQAKGFVLIKPNHESSIRLPPEVSDSVFCHFSNIAKDQLLYPNDEVRFSIKMAARENKKYEAAQVSVIRFVDPRLEGMTWTKLAAESNASIVVSSNSASSVKQRSQSKDSIRTATKPSVTSNNTSKNNNHSISTAKPVVSVSRQSAGFIYEVNHSMNPQKRVGVVGLTIPLPQNEYVLNFTYQSLKTVDQPLHLNDLVIFNVKGASISDLEPTVGKPLNHFDAEADRQFISSLNKCAATESHFLRGHKVNTDETRIVEFKSLALSTNPNPLIRFNAQKYTSSFLHSDGGVLWTGISDSGVVEGLSFDQKRRDEVRLLIDGAMSSMSPSVPTEKYNVKFHQVWDKVSVPKEAVDMFSSSYTVNEDKCTHYAVLLPDVYVLSISVVADPKHTYFTSGVLEDGTEGSTKAYLRRDGSTREMSSAELMRRMNEISHREKEELSEQLRKKDEMLANLMSRLGHGSPTSQNIESSDQFNFNTQ